MEKQQLEQLLVKGINVERQASSVKDLVTLSKARNSYVLWRKELQDFFSEDPNLFVKISPLFQADKVIKSLERGVGVESVEETFSQKLIDNIQEETKSKIQLIRDLYEKLFSKPEARLISRDANGTYNFKGKKIEIQNGVLYSDWFKIIFNYSGTDGYIEYELVTKLLTSKGYKVTDSTLRNVIDNFFRHAKVNGERIQNQTPDGQKIIKPARGKFLFTNPLID